MGALPSPSQLSLQPPLSSGLDLSAFSPPSHSFAGSSGLVIIAPYWQGRRSPDVPHNHKEVGDWKLIVISILQIIRLKNHPMVFSQLCYE